MLAYIVHHNALGILFKTSEGSIFGAVKMREYGHYQTLARPRGSVTRGIQIEFIHVNRNIMAGGIIVLKIIQTGPLIDQPHAHGAGAVEV